MALTEAEIQVLITACDTAIVDLLSGKVRSYRIGRRQFTRHSLSELRALRKYYKEDLMQSIPCEEVTVFDDEDV